MQEEEVITEKQINRAVTQKLRKDPKYQRFMTWLKNNGALIDSRLAYPTAFGSNACVGVSCSEKIESYKAIIGIPRKIIIDTDKVKQIPQFTRIIEQNPRLFNSRDQSDAAFNLLSLFLISEQLKGDKSFYWPYFQVCECKNLLMNWNKAEMEQLENRAIVEEILQYKDSVEKQFMTFLRVIRKYDKIFPPEIKNEAYKKMFQWAHEFVMTRAFGWSVPWASLIPFADMLNHGEPHLDHFITDIQRQKQVTRQEKYIQKKNRCNMGIFKKEYLQLTAEQLKELNAKTISARRKYIIKHQKLVEGEAKKVEETKAINHILHQQYNSGVHTLRQLYFAESSCSEDNDTDEDELDDFEEKQYSFRKHDKAILKGTHKTPLKASIKKYWDIFAQCDSNQKLKRKTPKPKEPVQQEDSDISARSMMSQQSSSSEEEEEQWTWMSNSKEEDVYFVLYTKHTYSKNQQVHNFYGRRTNKFLLLGYNFATLSNRYDSFPFRMMIDPLSAVKPVVSKIVYSPQLNLKERPNALKTKQIRIKQQRICIELIDHCRCVLLPVQTKDLFIALPITIPTSIPLEQSSLNLAKDILKYQLSQFYTDAQQDEQVIGGAKTAPRVYTAAVIRLSFKNILKEQVRLLDKCLEYLGRWKKGKIILQEKEMNDVRKIKEYLYELERSNL